MKTQWEYQGYTIVLINSHNATIYQNGIKVEKLYMIGGKWRDLLKFACRIINERD